MATRPQFDDPSAPSRRWRLWSTRLWILSAVLAAATLYSFVSVVHDKEQRRAAARLIVVSTAREAMSLATARMEVLSLGAFAPVAQTDIGGHVEATRVLESLTRRQRASESCRCRETFPVDEFFSVNPATGAFSRASVRADSKRDSLLPATALVALARTDAARATHLGPSMLHLSASRAFGDRAALTLVQRDGSDSVLAVWGLVGPARGIVQAMFQRGRDAMGSDSLLTMPHLDLTSLQVSARDGTRLYGDIGPDHTIRATVEHRGPLEGLEIVVALAPHQIPHPLLVLISPHQLWHNGVLTLCTTIAVLLAIGASRREILLARARSDFIAGVSHDLRMPLAQILLASETLTLRRERDETERMALTSSIVRETQRLIGLVENVLLFTRSGKVQLRAQEEQLRVDDLFADVVDSVHLAVADAEQSIQCLAVSELVLLGDRHLLRQALVNLVDNAIKYGAQGQRITLAAESYRDERVRLFVDDQGQGIPERERTRVFEPYERLARDQVSERSGSGLGLAVVRQIVGACKGQVWVDSAPEGGARVVIELRRVRVAEPSRSRAGVA